MIYFSLKWDTEYLITREAIVTQGVRLSGLKCCCVSKRMPVAPFIRNFMEVTSLMYVQHHPWYYWSHMTPMLLFLVQNTWDFLKTWLLLELLWYTHIEAHDISIYYPWLYWYLISLFNSILPIKCQYSMKWPNMQCANLSNMLIANTHLVWMQSLLS